MEAEANLILPPYNLKPCSLAPERPMRYGWPIFNAVSTVPESVPFLAPISEQESDEVYDQASDQTQPVAEESLSASSECQPASGAQTTGYATGVARAQEKTITIAVIDGPAKGVVHQIHKDRTTIGCAGGEADIQIDDPKISPMHCVLELKQDTVRLCDLDSAEGTYTNDERIQAVEIKHLSDFRIGSSVLLLVIHPQRAM